MRSSSPPSNEELSCYAFATGHGTEGVCLLVKMGPYQLLLDCGLEDVTPLIHTEISLVWCSHAHAEHARGLRYLHTFLPQVPIYTSEVTTELLSLDGCQALPWHCPIELQEGLTVEIMPAGHLPGAAVALFTYQGEGRSYSLLYTGDFFLSNGRFAEGLSLATLRAYRPDVLILEGTYGTARQPHRRQQENRLVKQVSQALKDQQLIGLLAPSMGQAQEIILLLRSHHQFTGRDVNIWVDAEIAEVCDRYLRCVPHLPGNIQNFAHNQSLFWDDKVRPRVRRLAERPEVGSNQAAEIFLVSDIHRLTIKPELVFLPADLAQEIAQHDYAVQAYLLTDHSDGLGTTQLIHNLRPQHVVFVHGSPTYLGDLTGLDELNSRYQLHLPAAGTLVELPIGDNFMQAAAPGETSYAGELTETTEGVSITFPLGLTSDPRWQNFADTGLVEARWQGEELVLRGITPRQLMNEAYHSKVDRSIDCCGNCRYQRANRCGHSESALYGFKVSPTGCCPLFGSEGGE